MKYDYIRLLAITLSLASVMKISATEEILELKYGPGGGKIQLHKSHTFIGIKPIAQENNMEAVLGSKASKFSYVNSLGGFKVLRFKESEELNRELDNIRASINVGVGTHAYHTSAGQQVPFVPTGHLYLKFVDNSDAEECSGVLDKLALEIVEARGTHELVVKTTPNSLNPIKVAVELQRMKSLVQTAEPDLATPLQRSPVREAAGAKTKIERVSAVDVLAPAPVRAAFSLPTDSLFKDQWHLGNTGTHRGTSIGLKAGADARVVEAWTFLQGYGSPDIKVAVIDDGFDLGHPDLIGKIVSPWDFTRNNNNPIPGSGDWHGTACAGVALGNLGGGSILGVAPSSSLMPVRWGTDLSDSQIENWFGYVTQNGADVVSCSWGAAAWNFPLSSRKYNAIHNCATSGRGGKGCVITFAAGNEMRDVNNPTMNSINGFAIHPDVIAVSASTSRDLRSSYSNYGKEIWVAAPSNGAGGMGILTSDVRGQYGYVNGDYEYEFGGTSSACPLTAGVCALVLSVRPELTSNQVKDILKRSARKIGNNYTNGHSVQFGYGCVNAVDAVKAAKNMPL